MLEVMESPYKNALDGPSRQLLWELGRLHLNDREEFHARLDRDARIQEENHKLALAAAAAEHERIRRRAEAERERLEAQIQHERRRREQEAEAEFERIQREREYEEKTREYERARALQAHEAREAELRRNEEVLEAEKRRLERERADAEAARLLAEQKEADQRAAEEERRAKEATAAAAASKPKIEKNATPASIAVAPPVIVPAPQTSAQSSAQQPRLDPTREAEHRRYLEIHQKAKGLRKFMEEQSKTIPAIKAQMGPGRRVIRKCMGQLTGDNIANKAPREEIIKVLREASKVTAPQIDVTDFLFEPPTSIADHNGPALLLYQFSNLAKMIISQFVNEAAVNPSAADPVGVVASWVFAMPEFRWNGHSFIDILIAKFHVVCPVLFGIYGPENTAQGKQRLGWRRETKQGPFVSEQRHSERMTGLGAGFAALSLRNYDRSRMQNPYPASNYWRALASIVNTPPAEVTETHFMVLKAIIEKSEARILEFFGEAGKTALRKALIEFPASVGARGGVSAKALTVLPDVYRRDKKLFL